MANTRTFGRRVTVQAQPATPMRVATVASSVTPTRTIETPAPAIAAPDADPVDQEVLAWKEARGSTFAIPWRQLYLMASLCFGVASFVLPDSVNDNVDYLLWGLMAMSAYAWYATRKKKTDIKAPAAP
jgi:hypothetical protein